MVGNTGLTIIAAGRPATGIATQAGLSAISLAFSIKHSSKKSSACFVSSGRLTHPTIASA
jgi:hypothetical protein